MARWAAVHDPAQLREPDGAGVAAGDEVDVDIEADTAPREVSVPRTTWRRPSVRTCGRSSTGWPTRHRRSGCAGSRTPRSRDPDGAHRQDGRRASVREEDALDARPGGVLADTNMDGVLVARARACPGPRSSCPAGRARSAVPRPEKTTDLHAGDTWAARLARSGLKCPRRRSGRRAGHRHVPRRPEADGSAYVIG